ncbi:hypothetical protein ACRYCC_27190 [Actinomadura scrupuli]|uniref:hypothetical protein n=1 Tax=Actinomadura scrupuli TaxID=559629 RepID=UPI003D98DE6A
MSITRTTARTTNGRRRRNVTHVAIATIVTGTLLYASLHHDLTDRPPKEPVPAALATPVTATDPAPDIDLAAVTWADYSGLVRLPTSATDGPRDPSNGLARGFARTPLGALLAAMNIAERANAVWGPAVFEATIKHQVIGGDADAMLAGTREQYEDLRQEAAVDEGAPLGRPVAQIEAYRWQGYTPAEATVDMVTARRGDDDLTYRMATRIQVRWEDNDWRVLAPPGGAWASSATRVDPTDGYTIFPGRR